MSSLEQISRELEAKAGLGIGSGGTGISREILKEILSEFTIEYDEKGNTLKVVNILTKTRLPSPAMWDIVMTMGQYLKQEFPTIEELQKLNPVYFSKRSVHELYDFFVRYFPILMVSKDGASRREFAEIMTGLLRDAETDEKSLSKKVSRI